MAAYYDETDHLVISADDARTGVTGHNVRYVLGFGLTGIVAAYAALAIYFGFDRLAADMSRALSTSPLALLQAFAPYAAIVLIGVIVGGLLLGLWHVVAGPSEDGSERFMRARVVAQFALVCIIMAMFYMARS